MHVVLCVVSNFDIEFLQRLFVNLVGGLPIYVVSLCFWLVSGGLRSLRQISVHLKRKTEWHGLGEPYILVVEALMLPVVRVEGFSWLL